MLNSPSSPLLSILEKLASLTEEEGGLIKIKPFRDWKGSSWQNKIFTMRLLNAGEMLEVYDFCDKYTGTARDQAYYIEIIIRSLFSVDGQQLAEDEEVLKYNQKCSTSLSRLEYLRLWAGNLEQVVLLRLHSIYEQLQIKQIRLVNGQFLCEISGNTFNDLPKDCKVIKYGIGEILSKEILENKEIDLSNYDFEKEEVEQTFIPLEENNKELEEPLNQEFDYICICGKGFNSFEEYSQHRENCEKMQ
jgi:hypothetical protein